MSDEKTWLTLVSNDEEVIKNRQGQTMPPSPILQDFVNNSGVDTQKYPFRKGHFVSFGKETGVFRPNNRWLMKKKQGDVRASKIRVNNISCHSLVYLVLRQNEGDSHENKVFTKNILYFPQLLLSYFILYM